MRRWLPILMCAWVLTGCATVSQAPPQAGAGATAPLASPVEVRTALYAQHDLWRGTPYVLGGTSRRGVDCSGFVQRTFDSHFGIAVPRTTELQSQQGQRIGRDALQAGDLVFFRTGNGKRHVGIYVEDGQFLHASTSRGVTLSRLDNPYWSRHYWQARRL